METRRLSRHERQVLHQLIRTERSARVVRRAQALLWLDHGESVAAVAERLGVVRQTIYNWQREFARRQTLPLAQRLADEARSGRPAAKLSMALHWVPILLQHSPTDYGYRARSWTSLLLSKQIAQQSQAPVGRSTVRKALHQLRYRFKRPRYVLARRAANWRQSKGG